MTWGDAMASVIGKRFGRHHYRFLGQSRSLEVSELSLLLLLLLFLFFFFHIGREASRCSYSPS
jgi:dolichol kinase